MKEKGSKVYAGNWDYLHFYCDLCLSEKLCIIKNENNPNDINKRNDIGGKCMHTVKFLLDKT